MNLLKKIAQLEQEIISLHNKNAILIQVINSLDVNIYWKNKDGKYAGMNTANLKAIGLLSEKQIMDKSDAEIESTAIFSEKINRNDQQVIQTGIPCEFEEDYLLENSEIQAVYLAKKSCLKDRDGNIIGLVGMSVNITERKNLEKELIKKKNQVKKKLEFQKNYLKSYGYDYVDALKVISDALEHMDIRLRRLDVGVNVRNELNNDFYTINEQLSELYTFYQKINTSILAQEYNDSKKSIRRPIKLKDMISIEVDLANGTLSAEFDVEVSFTIKEKARQQLYIDYKKLRHIIRTLFSNYTQAINAKKVKSRNIHLNITAKDGPQNKLYVTFHFEGNVPFVELENNKFRAEHFVFDSEQVFANQKHSLAYELSLAKHYVGLLSVDNNRNKALFEGPKYNFTLSFDKCNNENKSSFKPILVK